VQSTDSIFEEEDFSMEEAKEAVEHLLDENTPVCHTVRGTLMGTRLSFVVLSLLHMYAAEQACYQYGKSGYSKAYNIHGDDMISAWPEALFARYEDQLELLGFRINVSKGSVSSRGGTFCGVFYRVIRQYVPEYSVSGAPWVDTKAKHIDKMLAANVCSAREAKILRSRRRIKNPINFKERRFVRAVSRPYLSSLLRLTTKKGAHNSETASLPSVLNANLRDCPKVNMQKAVMRVARRAHGDIFALYKKSKVPLTDPIEVLGAGVVLHRQSISRRGRQTATKFRHWPIETRSEFYRFVRSMHSIVRFPRPVRDKLFDLNKHVESFARRSRQRGFSMKESLKTLRASVLSQAFLNPTISKRSSSSLLSNNTAIMRWRNMRWLGKMLRNIYVLVGAGSFGQHTKFSMNIKEKLKKCGPTKFETQLIKTKDVKRLIRKERTLKLSKSTQQTLIDIYRVLPTKVDRGPVVLLFDTGDIDPKLQPHNWPLPFKSHR
jgi:hypothetical protein